MRIIICLLFVCICFSCKNKTHHECRQILKEWMCREILFPDTMDFYNIMHERVDRQIDMNESYKIVVYTDSIGCFSCKLELDLWRTYIDILEQQKVSVIFCMSGIERNLIFEQLEYHHFTYPVYIDVDGKFNALNSFPSDIAYQTFLLDKSNKVVAIGNPVHNPKVKELYMDIIQRKTLMEKRELNQTRILVKEQIISLGNFNWREKQTVNFTIHNVGKHSLVINEVTTSCGCTSVDYSKQPIHSGDSVSLQVTYKADKPEHFNKTITVYCNADPSLVHLKIVGDAE